MQDVSSIVPSLPIGVLTFVMGVFLGPAWSNLRRSAGMSMTLESVRDAASVKVPRRVRRVRVSAPRDDMDGQTQALIAGVTLLVAVGLYLEYRGVVLMTLFGLALLISFVACVVMVVASRHDVVSPSLGGRLALLMPFIFTVAGLVTVVFLWDPPVGAARFHEYVNRVDSHGVIHSLDGFGFVLYQLFGAVLFILVALGSIAFSMANLSALYVVTSAWGQPLWRLTYRTVSSAGSPWTVLTLTVVAILGLLMSGGWVYESLPDPGGS